MDTASPEEQGADAPRINDGLASAGSDEPPVTEETAGDGSRGEGLGDAEEMQLGGETLNSTDIKSVSGADIDTTSSQDQPVEAVKVDGGQLDATTAAAALGKDSVPADPSLPVREPLGDIPSAPEISDPTPEKAESSDEPATEEPGEASSPVAGIAQDNLGDTKAGEELESERVVLSPTPEVGEPTSTTDDCDQKPDTQQGSDVVEDLERLDRVEGCTADSGVEAERVVDVDIVGPGQDTGAIESEQVADFSPLPGTNEEEVEVVKQVVPVSKDTIPEHEDSASHGDTKSCRDECDGDLDRVFSQLQLKPEEGGDSSEGSFHEASGLDRDASSSLDSTANTNTPRPTKDVLKSVERPSTVEGGDSSSGEDCVSSKARAMPPSGRQQTKRIDLHHQFVREIVKIQQDRDQYEKQWQAAQQGTPPGSGGNPLEGPAAAHTQAKKRVIDVPSRKQSRRESSRAVAQEPVPMREGIAPDTVSMAWGRAPQRHGRGSYAGHGMGTQKPLTIPRNKVGVLPQPAREAYERGASQPSKAPRNEEFFQDTPVQRGKETSNRQQGFAPIYRPPNARDTSNFHEAEGPPEVSSSGLHHLAVVPPRPINPMLPAGVKTPLSPAPAGFSQFRGGLAGGPRASKERGTPFSTPNPTNATPNDRHTRRVEPQGTATPSEDSLGLKITFDTANQQRHIEYSKPAPLAGGEGDSIVITVSEHGRTSRVVSSPYNAPHSGPGPSRSQQQPDSGPVGPGSFNKGAAFGATGDAPGFQFKATPHTSNGVGILGKGVALASNVDRSKEKRNARNRHKEPAAVNREQPAGLHKNMEPPVVSDKKAPAAKEEPAVVSDKKAPAVKEEPAVEWSGYPVYKFIPSANSGWGDIPEEVMSAQREDELVEAVQALRMEPKSRPFDTSKVEAHRRDGYKGGMTQRLTDSRPAPMVLAESAHPVAAHMKWGDMVDSPDVRETVPLSNNPGKSRVGGNPNVSDVSESTSGSTGHGRRRAHMSGQEGDSGSYPSSGPGPIRGQHSQRRSGPWRSEEPKPRHQSAVVVTQSTPPEPLATVASTPSKKSVWDRLGPHKETGSGAPDLPMTNHGNRMSQDVRVSQPQAHRVPSPAFDNYEGAHEADSFSDGEYGDSSLHRDSKQKRSKFELYVPRRSTPGS